MTGPIASRSKLLKRAAALLLVSLGAACGGSDSDNSAAANGDGGAGGDSQASTTVPMVVSVTPLTGGTDVALNASVTATFNERMDKPSLNAATFTLSSPTAAVPGVVVYGNSTAAFWPASHLASNTVFTATITTGAKSVSGVPLAAKYSWTFTTGTTLAPGAGVSLGTASTFVILAKAGISNVSTSAITGNLGVSPIAATSITGFALVADSTNVFSTAAQVTGKVYAADYAVPTPANLTTAVSDMETAFTDAAARAPDVTELGAGDIGGKTLVPGVYKWGTGLLIPTDVTLNGSATDVWVFQIAQNLTVSSATKVIVTGGAQAKNIFWQVSGLVDLGTTAHFEGTILSQTGISLETGASINGRLLAQTAVTIAGSTVTQP